MAQRSEDGVGKTRETSKRLERAIPVWTRSAISIQASSRDDGCINRPDTRKHLNLCDQIFRIPPCIRWGVHTRSFKGPGCGVGTGHTFTLAASLLKDEGWDIPAGWLRGWERQVMPKADVVRSTARDITRFIQTRHFVTSRQPVVSG